MKNKIFQYEMLGSCHNVWACPLIMSSLSTESALDWGFISIKKMQIHFVLGRPGCHVPNVGGFVSP